MGQERERGQWRRVAAAVGTAIALVGLAACGDDDDDQVVATPDTTTADTRDTTTTTADTRTTTTDRGAQLANTLHATLEPLNRSGANGDVSVLFADNRLTVTVNARGVSPTLAHAQHIHIGGRGECPAPDAATNSDPKEVIDTVEGQPAYGPVKVSLTMDGAVGADSALAVPRFPVASGSGIYTYNRTFDLPAGTTVNEVKNGVVVVHGISKLYADQAKYDGAPKSSLDASLPLETTVPAMCGKLRPA
jgi:hypothetical protein